MVDLTKIANASQDFLKLGGYSQTELHGIDNIGDIFEVEWKAREGRGRLYVNSQEVNVVGFKLYKK